MGTMTAPSAGIRTIQEMQAFAALPKAAQRYIRRALEIRFGGAGRPERLARNPAEARSLERQRYLYGRLAHVDAVIPVGDDMPTVWNFIGRLAPIAAFDLGEQKIRSWAAFRFLYERLLGAAARPWLLSLFLMCAAQPHLPGALRLELLGSVDADSAGGRWSTIEPAFVPEWVESLEA